jgi:hypothetical protein
VNKILNLFVVMGLLLSGCVSVPTQTISTGATVTLASLSTVTVVPTQLPSATPVPPRVPLSDVMAAEMRGSFDFFWQQTNDDPNSVGFGLVRDRYPGSPGIASMAAVGFALTAYPIGVEKGYITLEQGFERANGTLDTLLRMERVHGFFYHFVDMKTGQRAWKSEVSSIDTALLMMGVLTAGEYFGGEVQQKAEQLYQSVEWTWFVDEDRQMFYMAYRPEEGFSGHWDFYAEQLILYILAAGSPTYPTDVQLYQQFTRHLARYDDGQPFIHSWFGSMFTYQFSHAWIDFRGRRDAQGVDWFENSVAAGRAQYQFAVNMDEKYLTLGPLSWGLSACDGPDGYNGLYGAPPSGYDNRAHVVDDTVPPYAAIASILFLPEEAGLAMQHYASLDALWGPYGLVDAYNLSRKWYASDVIGIDKGVGLLMLANAEDNTVYQWTMRNRYIEHGLEQLQIVAQP